ncbi:hypothetical protein EV385_3252 [Krasilnikovia cinnamomea]|uniref:AAA domain-containing protein n=1 Tax=Krasilnikovia cinnamomea TaxID=349313 RepID=A0A4Q7ZM52_9ACTN|nr:hypothetical protein [Krasilnikovia cinnamomea]RZU51425.1 hypothetical protein EV385_3252 [Krasilnikovia cinnamomea]
MLVFLVTGATGAGKSTVVRGLRDRGHRAISLDADPRLCAWTDAAGRRAVRPAAPDAAWLAAHRWSWDPARLDEIVAAEVAGDAGPAAWLCGYAANAAELADRFDTVFLLDIDLETMRHRLRDRVGNDFGRAGATAEAADTYYREFTHAWRGRGAVTIDASRDAGAVIAQLLTASGVPPRSLRR